MKDYSNYIFTPRPKPQDSRPWWVRLFCSIRPMVGMKGKVDPKTKEVKKDITIGIKGRIEF